MKPKITFFVDFDNTLIDNDKVKVQIQSTISKEYGRKFINRFLAINQKLREEKGYVDFSSTIDQIAKEENKPELKDKLHYLFHNFKFKDSLFSKAGTVIKYLGTFGQVVVITEGDRHYQEIKIKSSGIWNLVDGNVEIPIFDKVSHLSEFLKKYPSDVYYFIEDKPEVLKEIRDLYKDKIKTIHVCQGHYSPICQMGIFDLTVKSLKDLLKINFPLKSAPS
ncbi:hypothetical protein HYU92_00310 [Candidatus Curtissbacteria bacterium]|nr:hypothetical protein [Candidatus Curtissbacteria bacterium]